MSRHNHLWPEGHRFYILRIPEHHSALAILYAGKWAPVSLLIVVVVLFLFRAIYAEVVGALPLNGGAYNVLLNTTSKFRASIAACLTILSYMATAVISTNEAAHYGHALWFGLLLIGATIALLALVSRKSTATRKPCWRTWAASRAVPGSRRSSRSMPRWYSAAQC